jgi:hypothetical protein
MSKEMICAWLGLPADRWPPDHYTLLGLERGEADPQRIEQCVHRRLECLRPYQLKHPEQVTEALTRLAQAFDCLTHPERRQAYDASLAGEPAPAETPPGGTVGTAGTATLPATLSVCPSDPLVSPSDPLAWLFGPWNQSALAESVEEKHWGAVPPPAVRVPPAEPAVAPVVGISAAAAAADPAPVAAPDPVAEAAASVAARRGLGTKRALYYRIARTRQLLAAWEQVGRYVGDPERRLVRKAEAESMLRQLEAIRELLHEFPPLLGQAGQPGYSVIALARQPLIVQTFQSLLPSQREVLARHWQEGRELLRAHRRFLRAELRALKRRSRWARSLSALGQFLAARVGWWLALGGLVAVNLAAPELRRHWPIQLLFLAACWLIAWLIGGELGRRSWLDRPAAPAPARSPRPNRQPGRPA